MLDVTRRALLQGGTVLAAGAALAGPALPFAFNLPFRKFIAGEPMNPATNWLSGRS